MRQAFSGFERARGAAAATAVGLLAAVIAHAETSSPTTVQRFTAETTEMTPAGIALRIDVREWSNDASRASVVDALSSDSDVGASLKDLPTLGYVWRSDSGVGYSVKYAHRSATPDGERLTFVTDRRLGAYDFRPWSIETGAAQAGELDYSVVELYVDEHGSGDGTLSLAAEVLIDAASGTIALQVDDGTPRVLKDAAAKVEPF